MAKAHKNLVVVLVSLFMCTIILSSVLTVVSATTPAVPEFKLSWTTRVYDEPAATSQWSGEQTYPGSHTEVREVTIKIKNQPHEGYINGDINGAKEKLYYNVRVKAHSSNVWTEFWGQTTFYGGATGVTYQGASDSEVTYISVGLNGPDNLIHASTDVRVGKEVDFEVKALIGYLDYSTNTFNGQEGAWSNTQTLTIDPSTETTSSPTTGVSNPSSDSTKTVFSSTFGFNINQISIPLSVFVAVVAAFLAVIVLLLVFYRRSKPLLKEQR